MSAYERSLIRRKIAQTLENQTEALDRVYPWRVEPVFNFELPVISVYTRSDPIEIYNTSPRNYKSNLQVDIELVCKNVNSVDDDLDRIMTQVEFALAQDYTLDGLTEDLILIGTEMTIRQEGEENVGSAVLTVECPHIFSFVSDPSRLKTLERIHADWDLYGSNAHIDAEDDIEFPS
jgi:hypothetical protein